ncbi:hypothetical protein HMPREF9374_2935 [Desmospora sp. 8437]|nr:hypothetical protein HMPREF9374_2935 [Desmospora sp. 8437]
MRNPSFFLILHKSIRLLSCFRPNAPDLPYPFFQLKNRFSPERKRKGI